ncbi:MAG TPA: ribonuclease III domain-containing protein [Lachnospiraceae bacterium]|nr:ribonuclease III domain-containing protein [Lachnospiraceae bacterium]
MEYDHLLSMIEQQFELKGMDAHAYSPLTLAYIGDSVFDIVVKTVVVETANCAANMLHRKTSAVVKAETQAKMADLLLPDLSEEEKNILRRGRNAKSGTTAKNASVSDYRKATGLEALIGYLYLMGREKRLVELIRLGMDKSETEELWHTKNI